MRCKWKGTKHVGIQDLSMSGDSPDSYLSSCCVAVEPILSSSSVLRASSSSIWSLRTFSALFRACFSSSRSSCSSEIWASSSLIFFWAAFLAAASSSILELRWERGRQLICVRGLETENNLRYHVAKQVTFKVTCYFEIQPLYSAFAVVIFLLKYWVN